MLKRHSTSRAIDTKSISHSAKMLVEAQCLAAESVIDAIADICCAASTMANSLANDGKLYYIGAGSSGIMAAADAIELRGTFGIGDQQVVILMAGGLPQSAAVLGYVEDDTSLLEEALSQVNCSDTIIAVSASGTTPYTVSAANISRNKGASIVAISNNHDTDFLRLAQHQIVLATQPEIISGSTRMGAGTAQKIALNTMSTLMAIELGHVYNGMLVNFVADNAKLRARATNMVKAVANTDNSRSVSALAKTDGNIKMAVLVAVGASLDEAAQLLDSANGHLRIALECLNKKNLRLHQP